MTGEDRRDRGRTLLSFGVSFLFHVLLLLSLSVVFRRPLLEVPRSVTIELPNLNEVPVRDVVAEKKAARQAAPLARLFQRSAPAEERPRPVPVPSPAEPERRTVPTLDEHRRRHREELERFLEKESEEQPERPREEESDLLSRRDREAAQRMTGGPSAAKPSGGTPAGGAEAEVAGRLVMQGAGRPVVYQPPPPAYPEWARRDGVEGRVVVRVWFDKDGFAVDAAIVRSSGSPRLDSVARNYALQFRVAPVAEDREDEGLLTVVFELVR